MDPLTLYIVGDAPHLPSGLARIARDLTRLAVDVTADDPDLRVIQLGWGVPRAVGDLASWPVIPLALGDDWGATHVGELVRQTPGTSIVWLIWDPSRCVDYLGLGVPLWGYFAVDGAQVNGGLGGPAGSVIHACSRLLAYGRWGATVLRDNRAGPVSYLPHGLHPPFSEAAPVPRWTNTTTRWIGCVATNQPRKDFGLLFGAVAELRRRGHPVKLWLHTDQPIASWSVPELIRLFHLEHRVATTTVLTDEQLLQYYQQCRLTIAPGLCEGFGYPIVESLAAGVPVIHVDHGGGKSLVPRAEWRVPTRAWRLDGLYALQRPVCTPEDVANASERAWAWQDHLGPVVSAAYCQGAVAHLDWQVLGRRWAQWIREGIEEARR